MTPERYQRVREIFHAVCSLPDVERSAYLNDQCGGDARLRSEVESLLAHSADGGDAFEESKLGVGRVLIENGGPVAAPDGGPENTGMPETIGGFRVQRKLGQGGMGVVYEAWQSNPPRTVALKVVRPGFCSDKLRLRFTREAALLGRLHHPGIGHIYEAGAAQTPFGEQPYFAMELVEGEPLTDYAVHRGLRVWQRMELFAQVCDAVQHAHERGVIHRDLKPSNILVTSAGQPKILDFGIARPVEVELSMTTQQTGLRQMIGTLPYMSPEQVSGNSAGIDTRSDVYALGVVLFELLAGRLPYDLSDCSLPEAARVIRDTPPTPLSAVDRALRGDVSTIVATALEKESERRYQSAGELAGDIRRFLADQPLVARPDSTFYQFRKFARRNKALVGGAFATFVALLLGTIATAWFATGEARQRSIADASSLEARRLAYRVSVSAASQAIEVLNVAAAHRLLAQAPAEFRNWEWRHLVTRLDQRAVKLDSGNEGVSELQFSGDGATLLTRHPNRMALWDMESRALLAEFEKPRRVPAVWDAARARLAVISGDRIAIHETDARMSLALGPTGAEITSAEFSPDGARVAAGAADGRVHVWDAVTGQRLLESRRPDPIQQVAFSPTGDRLVALTPSKVEVLNATTGELQCTLEAPRSRRVTHLAWSADGAELYLAAPDSESPLAIFRYDITAKRALPPLLGHERGITSIQPAGRRRLLSCSRDGTARLWDMDSGEQTAVFRSETGGAFSAVLNPSGAWLAFGNDVGGVEVWQLSNPQRISVLSGHHAGIRSVAINPRGDVIAAGAADGAICFWDTELVPDPFVLRGHSSYIYPVAFSPDGSLIASGSWDRTVRLWDGLTGDSVAVLSGHAVPVRSLTFSSDGLRLASLGSMHAGSGELIVWDISTGVQVGRRRALPEATGPLAMHADGVRVWVPNPDDSGRTVALWNSEADLVEHAPLSSLRDAASSWISPDRQCLARLNSDRELLLVDLRSGAVKHRIDGRARSAAFSPDGRRVVALFVTAEGNRFADAIRVISVGTGRALAELSGHSGDVFSAVFSPDGSRIATCGRDATIRVWDAESYEEIVQLRGHSDYVWSLAFSPDGARLVSGSGDATVRIWDTRSSAELLNARRERQALLARLSPYVADLRLKLGDFGAVADYLRAEAGLGPRERAVLRQIVLRCSLNAASGTAPQGRPSGFARSRSN